MEIKRQSGNVFFTLFAIVTLIGVLGVGLSNFIKGPLRSSVSITRQSAAETKMTIASQTAIMAAANLSNKGDCDSDGMVEPLEFRDAGSLPAPIGGGLLPDSIGVTKTDPWGTEFGYCVWDHGPVLLNAVCQAVSGTNRRLQGYNSTDYPSVAIISAGPDRKFTTTCRNFSLGATRADQNNNGVLTDPGDLPLISKALSTDDDIIYSQTYLEAANSTGGLWSLKPAEPNQASIQKSLEVTGGANFTGTGTFQKISSIAGDFLNIVSGLKIAGPSLAPTCNATNKSVIRTNATSDGWEICDGSAWKEIAGTAASAGGVSWPLLAPPGALSAPSYSFASSLGSGMWYGSGSLRLSSTGGIDLVAATQINMTGGGSDFRVTSAGGVKIGNDTAACNASTAGTIKFVSNDYQYCNGTGWVAFDVGIPIETCKPSSLSFTTQSNVARDSLITSNTVTISGLDKPCYFIADFEFGGSLVINGSDTGKPFGNVQNGTTLALKARSSPGSGVTTTKLKNGLGNDLSEWKILTPACPLAAQTVTYATPGTVTFTAPVNSDFCTFTVTVKGGGGANSGGEIGPKAGGVKFRFVPGNRQSFNILIGAGGTSSSSVGSGGGASAVLYNNTLLAIAGGSGGGWSTYQGGRGGPYGTDFQLKGEDGAGGSSAGKGGSNNTGGAAGIGNNGLGGSGGSNGANGSAGTYAGLAGNATFSVSGGGGGGSSAAGGGGSGYGGGGGSPYAGGGGGGGGFLRNTAPYKPFRDFIAVDGPAAASAAHGSVVIQWGGDTPTVP